MSNICLTRGLVLKTFTAGAFSPRLCYLQAKVRSNKRSKQRHALSQKILNTHWCDNGCVKNNNNQTSDIYRGTFSTSFQCKTFSHYAFTTVNVSITLVFISNCSGSGVLNIGSWPGKRKTFSRPFKNVFFFISFVFLITFMHFGNVFRWKQKLLKHYDEKVLEIVLWPNLLKNTSC